MASKGLGTLTLSLAVSLGAFTPGLDKAGRELDKRAKRWAAVGNQIGNAIGVGLAAGLTAAVVGIKSTINAMDDLSKAAQKVGLPTEELSKLAYAGKLADVELETLTTSLGRLTKAQAAALNSSSQQAKVFDALGISVANADGSLRSSGDVLEDFADRFQELKGSPEAIAAGMAIFGKSFQQLIPLLKDGGDGIRAAGDELENLGGVLSGEAGRNAEQFNDNLERLKVAVSGVGLQVASNLLPQLVELTDNLADVAREGTAAAEIADTIGNTFRVVGTVIEFVGGYFRAFSNVLQGATAGFIGLAEAAKGVINLDWDQIKRGIALAQGGADLAYYGDPTALDGPSRRPAAQANRAAATNASNGGGQFANVNQSRAQVQVDQLRKALSKERAAKSGGGGAKKTGKSDEEREAERLLETYNRMEASYREQIALVGDVTEVEKLRYELANGDGKNFTQQQKDTLSGLALQRDAIEAANKQTEEAKRLTESLFTPTEAVNKQRAEAKELLDAGAISQETYNRALAAQLTPYEEVNAAILEQIELLGMSGEQQETYNNLKAAGVDANSEFGKSIMESTRQLQEERKQMEDSIAAQDAVRGGFEDFFTSILDGSKSAKDAFKDLAASILADLARIIAKRITANLFGEQGSNGGGSQGGWLAAFGELFGGGKAVGGPVNAGMFYRINENGPEMLSTGGRDYLMMGDQGGRITPNRGASGGGLQQVNNITVQGKLDKATREQMYGRIGREARRSTSRTR